jgi:Na+(H+)/acetate symporter ActP
MFANIDLYILAFSAVTVLATIWMGFRSAKKSKTASDFFVAGRSVGVGMNASAISGEYLSAASFMGIAGMVMSSGYDALWYPVCYACGYLFLLLFIAGPLRRFGAYTIPDFAEGRFDSPVFRKIAVVFVLFIGFFYTMPQMKGAGTTLAYIFPGLPYWAGVVLVGAVITLNVALGGMKGITLVQAFQYWAKMFAISVPIFVLMAVYGHYGKQLGRNGRPPPPPRIAGMEETWSKSFQGQTNLDFSSGEELQNAARAWNASSSNQPIVITAMSNARWPASDVVKRIFTLKPNQFTVEELRSLHAHATGRKIFYVRPSNDSLPLPFDKADVSNSNLVQRIEETFRANSFEMRFLNDTQSFFFHQSQSDKVSALLAAGSVIATNTSVAPPTDRQPLPTKAPADSIWLNPFGPLTTKAAKNAAAVVGRPRARSGGDFILIASPDGASQARASALKTGASTIGSPLPADSLMNIDKALARISEAFGVNAYRTADVPKAITGAVSVKALGYDSGLAFVKQTMAQSGVTLLVRGLAVYAVPAGSADFYASRIEENIPTSGQTADAAPVPLRAGLSPDQRMTVNLDSPTVAQTLAVYANLTGRQLLPHTNSTVERLDTLLAGKLSQWKLISRTPVPDSGVREHGDGSFTAAEVKSMIEAQLRTNDLQVVAVGDRGLRVEPVLAAAQNSDALIAAAAAQKAWLAKHEKPLALLYTYSLIIAIVCGTAGLPHILVRFYTNPDGTAAKKTTMWVMILIGVFYVFPPVFGVLGRNLLPELYAGVGAKGTDKIVLELPRLLNAKYPPLGSILSGITCAGAFAAFMSTFSGLLVSMTGALAHDVYGRILRPNATPEQRMRMFKIGAVLIGAVAILLGMQVEQLQINFMVGQAFAIAAASYFPLLFMAVWWRKLTMKGAATGMLTGGTLALAGISLTSFSDLKWVDLADFWAMHPLLRILCEQPAIWAVPLAITLMIIVSKLTAKTIPADSRMKMLVLHAPEQLGLKQEYIQEHQPH